MHLLIKRSINFLFTDTDTSFEFISCIDDDDDDDDIIILLLSLKA
jgi:hypothetical protein